MANWYPYPTNYSNGTSVDSVSKFFINYPTIISNGWIGIWFITIVWFVFFTIGMVSGVRKSMMVASFICLVLSMYLLMLGAINPVVPFVMLILTIIGAIGSKEEGGYL